MSTLNPERYLVFSLQDALYAIGLQQIAEVVEPPPLFPIPCAPGYFLGAMNFHGSLKSVLDLSGYSRRGSNNPQGRVVVLEDHVGGLALWVDCVSSIISAESIMWQPTDDGDELTEALLVSSTDRVRLLALDKLLQQLETTING